MSTRVAATENGSKETILRDCLAVLRNVAAYHLPAAMDRRLLWLSENKESLTSQEREELLALVELAEDRTLDKVQARALLRQVEKTCPELLAG
jgi:hypothetical protein